MMGYLDRFSARELGFLCAAASLVFDQASKLFLLYGAGFIDMQSYDRIRILPFFDMIMVWNPGISYGLFAVHTPAGRVALVLVAALAIAGLCFWLWNTTRLIVALGLGMVIGGAIANNLIDRTIYGRVADFFYFHGFGHDWYVFNVADILISAGVAAILYDTFWRAEAADLPRGPRSAPGE